MNVTTIRKRPIAGRKLQNTEALSEYVYLVHGKAIGDLRLDRLADGIQHIFNLACLCPDGIERARLAPVLDRSRSKRRLGPNSIASRSSHLRHCAGCLCGDESGDRKRVNQSCRRTRIRGRFGFRIGGRKRPRSRGLHSDFYVVGSEPSGDAIKLLRFCNSNLGG